MAKFNIDELVRDAHGQLQQGNFPLARGSIESIRSLIKKRYANNANAWFTISALYGMLGDFKESEICAQSGVRLEPNSIQGWVNYGNALQSQGRMEESIDKFKRALAAGANLPLVHLSLATALQMLGRMDEAGSHYRKAAELDPRSPDTQLRLGVFLLDSKKPAEALTVLQALAGQNPASPAILAVLGRALLDNGRWEEALSVCEQALRLNPRFEDGYLLKGSIDMYLGRFSEAEESFKRMLAINPSRIEAMLGMAEAGWQRGGTRKVSMEYCRKALALNDNYLPAQLSLSTNLIVQGDVDEAHANIKRVLQQYPGNITAIGIMATTLHRKALYEDAHQLLLPYVERAVYDINIATSFADIARRFDKQQQAIAYIEGFLKLDNLPKSTQKTLRFTLGNLYDATKNYDRAFENYQQGNVLKGAVFDSNAHRREIDAMIEFFTKERMANLPRSSVPSELPIFVLGMPRSGTSLVEQILARHTEVHGAGELNEMGEIAHTVAQKYCQIDGYDGFARSINTNEIDALATGYLNLLRGKGGGAKRVVDKMPSNYMYLVLINLLFPGARVIHCCRDARDTCLSEYFQDFGGNLAFTYDLSTAGATHVQYQRLMAHWARVLDIPMLDVIYEELVADQESVSRKMVAFCGLEWQDGCLRFYESGRQVATRSYDQVRRPMYNSSVEKWRHYTKHLGPLFEALGN
jgi:tetratricopeptide (TPR) repeat protein